MQEFITLANQVNKLPLEEQPQTAFVCLLGMGTVFLGLICLVILCKIVGAFAGKKTKAAAPEATPNAIPVATASSNQTIENRQEIVAAVSAVIAEELGTDISALRILSFKKN